MNQKSTIPPGKKALFTLIFVLFTILLLAVVAEIGVRLMGYGPWQPPERSTRLEPEGQFFVPDENLGYKMQPGTFTMVLNDSLRFSAEHDADGYRITPRPELDIMISDSSLPEYWILGGSFTYGWGVGQEETFPAQLQKMVPESRIRNFGVGGYGNLQSYFQLQAELEKTDRLPDHVFLVYASFHDQRNTCNRYWMKAIAPVAVLEGVSFPYWRLPAPGHVEEGKMPVTFDPLPGQQYFAFANFLDEQKCLAEEAEIRSDLVTNLVIDMIDLECVGKDIPFTLVGIGNDQATRQMLANQVESGIDTFFIGQDLTQPGMNLEPWDPHPSALAHEKYAQKLAEYLHTRTQRP